MKVGFSSLVCPDWELKTMAAKAAELGFDGIELTTSGNAGPSPQMAEAAADPEAAKATLAARNIELVCIGCSAPLASPSAREVAAGQEVIAETIELARKLGCRCVRVPFGSIVTADTRSHALARVGEAFVPLVPRAARSGVTVLAENGGDLADSQALWFVLDAVSHPSVRACWNACVGVGAGDTPSVAVPRLSRQIEMVHVCDADFDQSGRFREYRLPGEGNVDWPRAIELLRGVFYDGYLMFHWPKALEASLPGPEDVLPKVVEYLRGRIDERQPVLSAYKKDKHAPNYGPAAETEAPSK